MTITVSDVSMTYATRDGSVRALTSLNLRVPQGEFLALVGPTGCGKSTLLKLTAGLLQPSTGLITIGNDVVKGPRTDIGFMFQIPVLLPWKSVLQNVLLQATARGLDAKLYESWARTLLAQVGLQGYEDRYTFELSGGMQQRVAFCRAVLHKPSVLLMDEPFGALDALTREQIGLELQASWLSQGGQTVLFVTHGIGEAVLLSDRVAVFSPSPGRILEVVDVGLPRPRTADVIQSDLFGQLTGRIRKIINESRAPSAAST